MTFHQPYAEPFTGPESATALPWEWVRERLPGDGTYWLATTGPDRRPHLVPVLAVWVDGVPHLSAGPGTRKARNLAADPRCVLSASTAVLDLVVHGRATPVEDPAVLERAAAAYRESYGWSPRVRDGALWEEGAPTAGPPPYRLYRVTPELAYGFPTTAEPLTPTRWRF